MYMAKWGPKGFLVSPEKIVTFDGFSTSIALKSDSASDTSGQAPTNTKGREPQTVSMSINYVRAAGVDPRAQFEEWSSLVGQYYPLYIGDTIFGPEYLMLTKVDLSDLQLATNGSFISAKIAVSFDEYTLPKAKASTGSTAAVNKARQQQAQAAAAEKKQFLKENDLTAEAIAAALAAKPYDPKEPENPYQKGLARPDIAPVIIDNGRRVG